MRGNLTLRIILILGNRSKSICNGLESTRRNIFQVLLLVTRGKSLVKESVPAGVRMIQFICRCLYLRGMYAVFARYVCCICLVATQ